MKPHIIYILDNRWKVWFLYPDPYAKKNGTDSAAMAHPKQRVIDFDLDEVTLETVRHELCHAWMSELSFVELQLTDNQKEEWLCEFFAKYGEKVSKQARTIFKRVPNLKKRKRC